VVVVTRTSTTKAERCGNTKEVAAWTLVVVAARTSTAEAKQRGNVKEVTAWTSVAGAVV
jgi:hypothetical protein